MFVPIKPRSLDDPRHTPVMLRGELVEQGWTDRGIAHQVRDGTWARPRHGAYVDGACWRALDEAGRLEVRTRAVLRQSRVESIASHTSGLAILDVPTWGLDLGDVHITRADGRAGRHEAGVRQHRGEIVADDRLTVHGVPVMHPTRLALETTMITDVESSLAVVNDLLHRELTTPERLAERYARGMVFWESSGHTDVVLRLADARIESVGESRTLYMLWRHGRGIPMPELNMAILDPAGNERYRVDFAWPALRVFLEFDGRQKYEKHRRPGESVADCVLRERARERDIERWTGWRCVRIVWADLQCPLVTVARIAEALAHAA